MKLTLPGLYFLDTSAVILMMQRRVSATEEALISFATLAELLTGVERVTNQERESAKVRAALGSATNIYPNRQTIDTYARINAQLQRIGKPIPVNDLWNAALAMQ